MYRIKRGLLLYNSGAILNNHMYPAVLLSTSGLGQAYIINANVAPRSGIGFFLQCYIAKGQAFSFRTLSCLFGEQLEGKPARISHVIPTVNRLKNAHCLYCCQHMSWGGGNQQDARYLGVPPQARSYTKRSQAPWIIYKGTGKKLQMSF